jgi:hypothetical protein
MSSALSLSTINTIRLSANYLDVSDNLITNTLQSNLVSPFTSGGELGIVTRGTNETVNIGNSTSTVKLNGDVQLVNVGNFRMNGFFNQLQ